jgi:hypothetical protein
VLLPGLYFIPSDVPDPVQHMEALLASLPTPPLMSSEVMFPTKDPTFPKHYVLLHNVAGGADERK